MDRFITSYAKKASIVLTIDSIQIRIEQEAQNSIRVEVEYPNNDWQASYLEHSLATCCKANSKAKTESTTTLSGSLNINIGELLKIIQEFINRINVKSWENIQREWDRNKCSQY